MSPEVCPKCGAEVPPQAKACPECGSDETTGWSEQARYDELDLPDDPFDYGDFVKREFGGAGRAGPPRGVSWFWWLAAILALAGLLTWFVF